MKIVVLDGHTLNPGDLDWGALAALGDLTVYERTDGKEVVQRALGADAVYTNKTPLTRKLLYALSPSLKFIGVLATGYNIVDIAAAHELGIPVCNVPAYSSASVAQMTFALLLELCTRAWPHSEAVHSGEWSGCRDFCFWKYPLTELEGKSMGIVGFGHIGQRVAAIAATFGMEVLVHTRTVPTQAPCSVCFTDMEQLLSKSDVVSLHLPLTPQSEGIMDESAFRKMKPEAYFLNTSRGPLVVEHDLAAALRCGWIAGAGLDVLSTEPPAIDNPLLTAPNCIITPHISWATKEARARLMQMSADNLRAFLSGAVQNDVTGGALKKQQS